MKSKINKTGYLTPLTNFNALEERSGIFVSLHIFIRAKGLGKIPLYIVWVTPPSVQALRVRKFKKYEGNMKE